MKNKKIRVIGVSKLIGWALNDFQKETSSRKIEKQKYKRYSCLFVCLFEKTFRKHRFYNEKEKIHLQLQLQYN